MLSLRLKSGEYLTIGDNIAVQVFEETCSSFCVSVKAPREIPILRGELLERDGERPSGLYHRHYKRPSERERDAKQLEKLNARKKFFEEEAKREAEQTNAKIEQLLALTDELGHLAGHCGGVSERLEQLRDGLRQLRRE